MNRIWLQFLSYAGLLVISLVMQLHQPEMFALFCTPLPVGGSGNQGDRLELPLNAPIVPMERVK
jgi:hypothetical protein